MADHCRIIAARDEALCNQREMPDLVISADFRDYRFPDRIDLAQLGLLDNQVRPQRIFMFLHLPEMNAAQIRHPIDRFQGMDHINQANVRWTAQHRNTDYLANLGKLLY